MLSRNDIVEALYNNFVCPENIRISKVDYSNNPIAPEETAYRITFRQFGEKKKVTYWPNTVGFQG